MYVFRHHTCTYLAREEVVEVAVEGGRGALVLGDVLDHGGVGHFLVHVRVTLRQELEPTMSIYMFNMRAANI